MFFTVAEKFRSGRALKAFIARAPELRPLHSVSLAGGLGFFPFGAAFLLTLAHGDHAGGWFFFWLGFFFCPARSAQPRSGSTSAAARRSNQRPAPRQTRLCT